MSYTDNVHIVKNIYLVIALVGDGGFSAQFEQQSVCYCCSWYQQPCCHCLLCPPLSIETTANELWMTTGRSDFWCVVEKFRNLTFWADCQCVIWWTSSTIDCVAPNSHLQYFCPLFHRQSIFDAQVRDSALSHTCSSVLEEGVCSAVREVALETFKLIKQEKREKLEALKQQFLMRQLGKSWRRYTFHVNSRCFPKRGYMGTLPIALLFSFDGCWLSTITYTTMSALSHDPQVVSHGESASTRASVWPSDIPSTSTPGVIAMATGDAPPCWKASQAWVAIGSGESPRPWRDYLRDAGQQSCRNWEEEVKGEEGGSYQIVLL